MARPMVILSGRHRPHELLLLGVSLGVGVAYIVGTPAPESIAALLPAWALDVWAAGLILSGLVGLAGALTRRSWSLGVEQAGMLVGAGALIWYTAALATLGVPALFAGTICAAWAAANIVRSLQIRRDLRALR